MAISCGFDSSGSGDDTGDTESTGSAGSGADDGTSGGDTGGGGETSDSGGGGATGGGTTDSGDTGGSGTDSGGGTETGSPSGDTTTGGSSSGGTGTGSSSGGTTTGGSSSGGTGTGSSSGGTTTGGSSSGGTGTGSSSGGTTTGGVCDPGEFVKEIELVENAVVEEPMQTAESTLGEGVFAFSEVEEQGTVTFSVHVPCEDEYVVWGRVGDINDGVNQNDPDSFYVSVDGGAEITWFYGCQTSGNNEVWSWEQVKDNELGAQCDDAVDLVVTLDTGVHTVRMRNREPANNDAFAAIARILVTNDQGYVPNDNE